MSRTSRPRPSSRSTCTIPLDLHGPGAINAIAGVCRHNVPVRLAAAARPAIARSRRVVDATLTGNEPHYGINTGFGSLAKRRVSPTDLRTLQRNLIRSHSAGVLEPLRPEVVRGMMLLLAASLSRGLSGVRQVVVDSIVGMLNAGLTPVVPSVGSVGASGDLAPLAAIALTLIGEGEVTTRRAPSKPVPAARAMARAGLEPIELHAKEGLALINGTHLMAAEAALLLHDAARVMDAATLALAMSIDACRATDRFLDPRLYQARNHAHAARVASRLRAHLVGSSIVGSHVDNDPRVQDPYSLRAGATILGAANAAIDAATASIIPELAAVTDNPLVFPEGVATWPGLAAPIRSRTPDIVSGANFHGMPLAIPLDTIAIALAHVAGVSERRTYLLTAAAEPEMHQRPYLVPSARAPGLQSGLMIAQYTAAACVNELVGLATPASVANVPTCAGMEDYNSFGPRAAAKARRALDLCTRVVAIELLCAAQGLESHRPLRSGDDVEHARRVIRARVKPLTDDRPLTADIEAIADMVLCGTLLQTVRGK